MRFRLSRGACYRSLFCFYFGVVKVKVCANDDSNIVCRVSFGRVVTALIVDVLLRHSALDCVFLVHTMVDFVRDMYTACVFCQPSPAAVLVTSGFYICF